MARTDKPNNSGALRVGLSKKDLARWAAEDVPQSIVKHWIEIGRKEADLDEKSEQKNDELKAILQDLRADLEDLKEENRKLVLLTSQMAHLLCISSTQDHFDVENLRFKAERGADLTQPEKAKLNLFKVKDFNFRRYLSFLFPGVESDRFLTLEQKKE